ncbi:MAG: hypothetical protein WC002_02565 [Candidatus Muiribacteriota bacterium]|jgi:hypothetical protein
MEINFYWIAFTVLINLSLITVILKPVKKTNIPFYSVSVEVYPEKDFYNIKFLIKRGFKGKLICTQTVKCRENETRAAFKSGDIIIYTEATVDDKKIINYTVYIAEKKKKVFSEKLSVKLEDFWGISMI